MLTIKTTPQFDKWLTSIADVTVRAAVLARIRRLGFGLMGDAAPVGDGVFELRLHLGAGWRVYLAYHRTEIIVLLAGGSKRTQQRDIRRAKDLARSLH